jgi:hypothetical protein
MRGTTILGVEDDSIAWARFYMEPVVDDGAPVGAAVAATVGTVTSVETSGTVR